MTNTALVEPASELADVFAAEPGEDGKEWAEALEAFALASTPVREPGADLRDRVLAAAVAEEPEEAPQKATITFGQFVPWLAAACFAIAAGAGMIAVSSDKQRLAEENKTLRAEVAALEEGAVASDLRIRELASQVDASFRAFIVWDDVRNTGVLKVENLPALGEDGDYQLWVVDEGHEHPLDGGVFDTEDGRAELQIVTKKLADCPEAAQGVTLFAISRERAGGVPISETKDFVLTAAY